MSKSWLNKSRINKSGYAEFLQFLLVGSSAAAINFISRIGFSEFFSYRVSIVFAYLVGMVVAFILFKKLVFKKSDKHYIDEIKGFVIVNILSILQVWIISVGLAEYLFPYLDYHFYEKEIAHFIGLAVPAISSYFGHKHFSFSNKTGN